MRIPFVRFARKISPNNVIEFGLIAAGIGVAITTVVDQVGADLNTLLASVSFGF